MNIYKGDCEVCGGWVGIENNFGNSFSGKYKILCGHCSQKERMNKK
jgi:hypothetical protein